MKRQLKSVAVLASVLLLHVCTAVFPVQGFLGSANAASDSAQTPEAFAAQVYYDTVWKLVDENFAYRDGLDGWQNWRHRYDGKLFSQADAERAVQDMMVYLSDQYTYFRPGTKKTAAVKASAQANDQKNSTGIQWHEIDCSAGKIGYVKIDTFASWHAVEGVRVALTDLKDCSGFVVDLRDNPGGYVDQATVMASLFLDGGRLTSTKGRSEGNYFQEETWITSTAVETRRGTQVVETLAREKNLAGGKPVTIIVNSATASAAEMFSGALQELGRARVVGVQTFGKGVMQRRFDFDNGALLNVTIAHWYLPNGDCVQWRGVIPDYTVPPTYGSDSQLDKAIAVTSS